MAGPSSSLTPSREHDEQPPVSPASLTPENPDVFSDDYAESFNESYADSIAALSPRHSRSSSPSSRRSSQHGSLRIIQPGSSTLSHTSSSRSRNSTTKYGGEGNERPREEMRRVVGPSLATNFSMRNRGSGIIARRSVSSASDFAGSQSPMSIGEGPSHPYGMYPQGLAMSRTASVASSARPFSNSTPARGPTHPYTLYTQNVGESAPGGTQQNSIPLGFVGSNQNYHRRIGPEGEEADIIGADGHAEQLPPYSQYPDEMIHKTVVAGGLPVIGEQRAEEGTPTSPDEVNSPPAQRATTIANSETGLTQSDSDEKGSGHKISKVNWRMKVFGLPLWSILMIFILIVFIAVICGAVLGAVIAQRHPKEKKMKPSYSQSWPDGQPTSYPPTTAASPTTLIDVIIPTTTPSWIRPLPNGTFGLNPGYPASGNASGCLSGPQQPAWSCSLHDDTLQMSITNTNNVTSFRLSPSRNELQYGVQAPVATSNQVQLVQDPGTIDHAYAWHFQTFYNKLVVLDSNNSILPLNEKKKRQTQSPWYSDVSSFSQRKSESDPQDVYDQSAWFCYWNQTFLEVLVYVDTGSNMSTSASGLASSLTSSIASAAASSVAPSSASYTTSSATSSPTTSLPPTSSSSQGSTSSSTYCPPSQSAPAQIPAPSPPVAPGSAVAIPYPSPASLYASNYAAQAAESPTAVQPRDAPTPSSPTPPLKVKVEERRIPDVGGPPPTCTLMTHNPADDTWCHSIGANGIIPVVALFEQDPPVYPYGGGSKLRKRDSIPNNACGCQWNMPDSSGS